MAMKKFNQLLFIALILILALTTAQAQDANSFLQVDYLKVDADKKAEFEKFQSEIWKPIHKARLKTKEISSWRFYRVQYPSGENTEYNYVLVTVFSSFDDLGDPYEDLGTIVERVHPGKSWDEINMKGSSLRRIVKSEVFKSIDLLDSQLGKSPPPFVTVDYMKVQPQDEKDYVRLETEIWKPIHQYRVDQGIMGNWALFFLQFPGGTNYPYTYATANYFDTWSQVQNSWPDDFWLKVHPDADSDNLVAMTHASRELVSSQIWRIVDHAQ